MGDNENSATGQDRPDDASQAALEGATAPPPPAPPECPHCGLTLDRRPTHYDGHWVFLEPGVVVAAHTVPPRRRWILTPDGRAMNLWDAEPLPGAHCRIAHRAVCPFLAREDAPAWITALRRRNGHRAQRLFDVPEARGRPDAG
ncbi:DUF6083 domain-containing protein [Streptomyces sp. NPDC002809]|uniref:DUF6083 domain-containing protein n=1 Tax=Streptomyces sp. NPDC002809 TaxID=3154433 RepID=UPI003325AAA3